MQKNLTFGKNKRFRVMVVSDIHAKTDYKTRQDMDELGDYLALQKRALTTLKPNLVVLLVDIIDADSDKDYKDTAAKILSPFIAREVPVAVVFGYKENIDGVSQEKLREIWHSFDICNVVDLSDISPSGDYNLVVRNYENTKDILNLWFMNISKTPPQKYRSRCPFATDAQLEWYESKANELKEANGGNVLPALNFQHTAVPEEYKLLKKVNPIPLINFAHRGKSESLRTTHFLPDRKNTDFEGHMGEGPGVPDFNNGQFDAWKKVGDVFGAFFGNDHMNDFVGTVDGIVLGQCKLAGFTRYGDGLRQGVRIVDVYEDAPNELKTRMCYYREIIGTNSISIKGFEKWIRDESRISVYNALRVAGIATVVGFTIAATRKYTRYLVSKGK